MSSPPNPVRSVRFLLPFDSSLNIFLAHSLVRLSMMVFGEGIVGGSYSGRSLVGAGIGQVLQPPPSGVPEGLPSEPEPEL
jgi:hypothetical protein